MALRPGTRLGAYEVLTLIDSGGMGEVYRARDTRLDRSVAIKILPSADPELKSRFEREARTIAALQHPHICTLFDVGHEDGLDYLVLEYLEGDTLAKRLRLGPIGLDDALKIAIEIADALDKAHSARIVHRDLKPGNIMLTNRGVKLLDFGLAKLRPVPQSIVAGATLAPTEAAPLTSRGSILGTLQYMAPEQLEGKEADHRSDIWAFGCIAYEMLTGRKAFEAKSQASLIAMILEHDPQRLSKLHDRTPPLLDHFVGRALAKNPEDRWQSARDARAELEWLRANGRRSDVSRGLEQPESYGAQRAISSAARPILAWSMATACAVATIILSILYVRASPPESRLITLSVHPAGGTTFDTIAVSPDGHQLAFTAADASGKINLWIRSLESSNARVLPGTEGAEFPFWSPDSRYIGYTARGQLHKIAVSGGPPQTIHSRAGTRGATWGRDGVIVFTPGSFSPLFRVSADGGDPVPVTRLDASRQETSHRWPYFLPDGRHYLFTIRSGRRDIPGIYAGALDSSERTRLAADLSNAAYATSSAQAGYLLFARSRSLMAQPFDINRLRLTGDPIVLADNVWYSGAWSHSSYSVSQDGVLVFDSTSRGRDVEIAWFDRSGARRDTIGEFYSAKFSLSLNDTHIALDSLDPQTGNFKLWTVDLTRGVAARLTPGSKDAEESPVWSPDGARIAFASGNALVERSSSGVGEDSVLLKSDRPLRLRDWSRDGRFLLFEKIHANEAISPITKGELWALPMSSADRKPFSVVQSAFSAAFSPDGKWVAYDSDESGSTEVYVQAFSTSGSPSKSQVSKGGGRNPHWRGDGKELFYLNADLSKLVAVPVTTSTRFEAGVPKVLFAGRFSTGITPQFNVTSDGQRFLITVPMATDSVSPASVVVNWPALLKK